jgi:hypothetical protein
VRFRDRQRARGVLATLTGIPLLLVAMLVLGLDWTVIAFMGAVGAVGSAIELARSSYRVVLTDATLHVQHGLRIRRVPVAAIEDAVVAPYRAADAMLGRGIHKRSLDGSVERYRAGGLRETVRVRWSGGGRIRTTIIATDRAEELAAAILTARSGAPERVRVELPVEREAIEEVEALLGAEPRAESARAT